MSMISLVHANEDEYVIVRKHVMHRSSVCLWRAGKSEAFSKFAGAPLKPIVTPWTRLVASMALRWDKKSGISPWANSGRRVIEQIQSVEQRVMTINLNPSWQRTLTSPGNIVHRDSNAALNGLLQKSARRVFTIPSWLSDHFDAALYLFNRDHPESAIADSGLTHSVESPRRVGATQLSPTRAAARDKESTIRPAARNSTHCLGTGTRAFFEMRAFVQMN